MLQESYEIKIKIIDNICFKKKSNISFVYV